MAPYDIDLDTDREVTFALDCSIHSTLLCWGTAWGLGPDCLSQWGQPFTLPCYGDPSKYWFKNGHVTQSETMRHEGKTLDKALSLWTARCVSVMFKIVAATLKSEGHWMS